MLLEGTGTKLICENTRQQKILSFFHFKSIWSIWYVFKFQYFW